MTKITRRALMAGGTSLAAAAALGGSSLTRMGKSLGAVGAMEAGGRRGAFDAALEIFRSVGG